MKFNLCSDAGALETMRAALALLDTRPCPRPKVRFADGRASKYFYYDDILSRRLRPEILTSEAALEQAKAFARAERDKN